MRDSGRPSNLLFRASQVGFKRWARWTGCKQSAIVHTDRLIVGAASSFQPLGCAQVK